MLRSKLVDGPKLNLGSYHECFELLRLLFGFLDVGPGVGRDTHGSCAGRGTCHDDILAAKEARKSNASNMSVLLARGRGSCKCNHPFNGTGCDEGQCPAGNEYVTGKMQPDSCKACQPNHFKTQPGNYPCQPADLFVAILTLASVLAGGFLPVMLGNRIPIQEISNTGQARNTICSS